MDGLELGVFLPVAKNGFLRSVNAPPYQPAYRDQLEIARLAEQAGLDYLFSMMKWRGRGGASRYWDSSLDSFSLMTALAAATRRIKLIATVNPLLVHPAVMAKMSATVQDVSGGRLGLNIVTGVSLEEYAQMGVVPDGYDRQRYAYAEEWLTLLKALWREPSVTRRGGRFQLTDCVSEPKPSPEPFLVCAGLSDEGLAFSAREADYAFITAAELADLPPICRRLQTLARAQGRPVKACTVVILVIRDSMAEASAYWNHLLAGADLEANRRTIDLLKATNRKENAELGQRLQAELPRITTSPVIVGDPPAVAAQLVDLHRSAGIDNFALVFPDYVDGLKRFAEAVLPELREVRMRPDAH